MVKMWKVVFGSPTPKEVECEIPKYPNEDSDGETISENTHFLELDDAWKEHLQDHEAAVKHDCGNVRRKRKELTELKSILIESTLALDAAKRAYEEYRQSDPRDPDHPCRSFKTEGAELRDCEGDGHYLCDECVRKKG